MDAQMLQARQVFLEEAKDLLQAMETILLNAENGDCDADAINALFRSAHTIKGSAGLFGLEQIVTFTHTVENVLENVRSGKQALQPELINLLLECADHLEHLTHLAEQLGPDEEDALLDTASSQTSQRLLSRLSSYLNTDHPITPTAMSADKIVASSLVPGDTVAADTWHISLRLGPDVFRNGMDPLCFISCLAQLGEIKHIVTLIDAMPDSVEMDPESCYLGFEIDLFSQNANKEAIAAIFEFVREDCTLRIIPPFSALQEYIRLIDELPEDAMRIGEILVRGGALTQDELDHALASQAKEAEEQRELIGEILLKEGLAQAEVLQVALEKQTLATTKKNAETKSIKVSADRLDTLINLVGELVIAGATTSALASKDGNAALLESTNVLSGLVEEIRDQALRMRMVPIGETFARFPRVVRDVSRELGKSIELKLAGGETELDKSMVDHIGDPLMHLVRNAIDHGIEPSAQRIAAGKPASGTLSLNAFHDSGNVVLEISDDGGGLNGERIRTKAIERGLISDDTVLTDKDLFRLIFEPGFSTAAAVTNLSGRGVGMDVVKRNIEAMRGSIDLDSTAGKGTTIRLHLPLTLAIIDGFVISVVNSCFIVPLELVIECLELKELNSQTHYLNLRGEVLPFVRLRDLFELDGPPSTHQNVVVVRCAGQKAGIVVDQLHGEAQTVIKPMPSLFKKLRGISGSTILGSGEVGLILDVMALIGFAKTTQQENPAFSHE